VPKLVRISAQFVVGPGPGRGAWLCADHPVECLEQAIKRRAVARALRVEVNNDDLASLRAKLEALRGEHEKS
jgi:predicted RNA-binding protein YlxR (DUF448 family)